jgi:signal transduction histidine kinase
MAVEAGEFRRARGSLNAWGQGSDQDYSTLALGAEDMAPSSKTPPRRSLSSKHEPHHSVPVDSANENPLREALLYPRPWREALSTYASAVNVAVAMTSPDGVVGEVLNPQPLWALLRGARVSPPGHCTFSLAADPTCHCVARAVRLNGTVYSRDSIGLVHFALPLSFGGKTVGALIAGQVFEQFPEPQALERLAAKAGVSATRVWQAARRAPPRGAAILHVYARLLGTLASTILNSRYHGYLGSERLAASVRVRDEMTQRADELVASAHRKDEFLAILAHELRNPLAPVVSALQTIQMRGRDRRSSVSQALGIIHRQVEQLVRLVNDLLDVGRMQSGQLALDRTSINLGATVLEAVEAVRATIDQRNQALDVETPAEPVWVHGDPVRLVQVFTNLLNNASKFTPREGKIGVAVEPAAPDAVAVRVWDTGVGIPAPLLPHVFDLFVRASESASRGGLGIGLTVVRRLVELHGGTVRAESAGPGKGSTFVVHLPRVATPAPLRQNQQEYPLTRAARRVLVVDDNADAATSLRLMLEQWGHEVHTAQDGETALEIARRIRPELVLLDIGLPNMDGYEVGRRIRSEITEPRPTLVAVTGYGQEADRRRSYEAGFDHHMLKPVDVDILRHMLN